MRIYLKNSFRRFNCDAGNAAAAAGHRAVGAFLPPPERQHAAHLPLSLHRTASGDPRHLLLLAVLHRAGDGEHHQGHRRRDGSVQLQNARVVRDQFQRHAAVHSLRGRHPDGDPAPPADLLREGDQIARRGVAKLRHRPAVDPARGSLDLAEVLHGVQHLQPVSGAGSAVEAAAQGSDDELQILRRGRVGDYAAAAVAAGGVGGARQEERFVAQRALLRGTRIPATSEQAASSVDNRGGRSVHAHQAGARHVRAEQSRLARSRRFCLPFAGASSSEISARHSPAAAAHRRVDPQASRALPQERFVAARLPRTLSGGETDPAEREGAPRSILVADLRRASLPADL